MNNELAPNGTKARGLQEAILRSEAAQMPISRDEIANQRQIENYEAQQARISEDYQQCAKTEMKASEYVVPTVLGAAGGALGNAPSGNVLKIAGGAVAGGALAAAGVLNSQAERIEICMANAPSRNEPKIEKREKSVSFSVSITHTYTAALQRSREPNTDFRDRFGRGGKPNKF